MLRSTVVFSVLLFLIALPNVSTVQGDEVGLANSRFIWIGDGGTGSESLIGYYIHQKYQGATLMQFDLSAHMGGTATSDATFRLPVDSFFSHWSSPTSHTMQIWQLNNHNADVDLDDADRNFRDVSLALPWMKHDGSSLSSWNTQAGAGGAEANFFDALTGAGASPLASTSGVTVGNDLVWTISQATLQSWLDGDATPTIVFAGHEWQSGVHNGQWGFNGGASTLNFGFSPVPEPGSLLVGFPALLGLFMGRRRRNI